jgi:predicted AAA+ superfamily ATPase
MKKDFAKIVSIVVFVFLLVFIFTHHINRNVAINKELIRVENQVNNKTNSKNNDQVSQNYFMYRQFESERKIEKIDSNNNLKLKDLYNF